MKTTIAFRVTDTALTGDYTGGDITLDIVRDAYAGTDLLSSAGNWTTTELGRGVYLLDLPGITVHSFISLTNTKNAANIKYDGYTNDFATAAIAVRDVDNSAPVAGSLGASAASAEDSAISAAEFGRILAQRFQAYNMMNIIGWNFGGSCSGTYSQTIPTGGYIKGHILWEDDDYLSNPELFTLDPNGFTKDYNTEVWSSNQTASLILEICNGTSEPLPAGTLSLSIPQTVAGPDVLNIDIEIPRVIYCDMYLVTRYGKAVPRGGVIYPDPGVDVQAVAVAVRDVNNTTPAAQSLGQAINRTFAGTQVPLFNAYGWHVTAGSPSTGSFNQTLPAGATLYFSIRGDNGGETSFGDYNGTWTSYDVDTWTDDYPTILLDVDFEIGDTIPAGEFTITVPQTVAGGETGASRTFVLKIPTMYGIQDGIYEHTPRVFFRADGSPLVNTATGADPQAIAEAVRDVDNTSPAGSSLGAVLNATYTDAHIASEGITAATEAYFHDLICVAGWKFTVAGGNPVTAVSFDGTIATGGYIMLRLEWKDNSSNTLQSREIGSIDSTNTWTPEAAFDLDLSCFPATITAYNSNHAVTTGTLSITVSSLHFGTPPLTLTLPVPDIISEWTCYLRWDKYGRCIIEPTKFALPPGTTAIAEAVRDVDNTAPVSGSFGESSREAWEAAQRTMDRVLANELLGIQDLASISATYTGEITGDAQLRIYYVQMSNMGINYSGKVLLGHVGSGGYVDNGTANGVYAAGILVSANLAGGTIAGGKLTITLVDQQGIVARDIYIDGSYAGAFWAFLGKHDGQLLGWAGEDSWDQETMYQTVRPPISDKFVRNKLDYLPLTMLNRFVTATSWVKADFTATTTSVITGDALLEVWGYNLVESTAEPNIGGYTFGQSILLGSFDSTGVWTFGVDWTEPSLSRDIIEIYAGGGSTGSISAGKLTISTKRYGNPDNSYEVFVTKVPAVSTGGGDGGYIMVDGSLSYQTGTGTRFASVSQAVLDTTSIAEAVRDISNDGATLGQMVKASAEIMLAQQVIGTNGLDSITATFDGTLNGTAYIEIRISDTVMWNGGFPSFDENSPNTVLLGTLTSSGWTEENHGGGFWSAALHALLKTGVGESIVGGKLTLSITDQTKQSYTQSWVMPSVGESVTTARWFGKDGSLLAYAFDGGSSIGTIVSGAASDPAAIAIAVRDELAVDGVKLGNTAHGGANTTLMLGSRDVETILEDTLTATEQTYASLIQVGQYSASNLVDAKGWYNVTLSVDIVLPADGNIDLEATEIPNGTVHEIGRLSSDGNSNTWTLDPDRIPDVRIPTPTVFGFSITPGNTGFPSCTATITVVGTDIGTPGMVFTCVLPAVAANTFCGGYLTADGQFKSFLGYVGMATERVTLADGSHGGAAATFQTAAGVLSQESAAGAIEAAVADATLRILNHVSTDCISVCGWDGSVSSGLSITYSGALNGGRLTIMGENKTSTTNTALGYFDGTGWHKDAGWDGNTLSDDLKLLIEADASAGTGDLTPGQIVITVAHDAQKGYGYTLNPIYIPGAEQGLSVSYFARTNGEVITDSGLSWRTVSPPSDVSSVY